ncbi:MULTISPECIES: hypothetical protein [Sphingobacterium]|uniref:hypothetical protein n=1 Tax=Sphingobacterium TaxID=28453 RepID=UPI00069B78FC|nr:hypothetical protein [Sphingobacterium sp. Ag1]
MKAKQLIWILLPLMLLQSFSSVWLWTVFEFNRDYIAKNECINRFNEKALSCRGQCILMKKMREHEEKEQKNLESRIIDLVFINNQQCFNLDITFFEEAAAETLLPEYQANYAYRPIFTIFHPPLA